MPASGPLDDGLDEDSPHEAAGIRSATRGIDQARGQLIPGSYHEFGEDKHEGVDSLARGRLGVSKRFPCPKSTSDTPP